MPGSGDPGLNRKPFLWRARYSPNCTVIRLQSGYHEVFRHFRAGLPVPQPPGPYRMLGSHRRSPPGSSGRCYGIGPGRSGQNRSAAGAPARVSRMAAPAVYAPLRIRYGRRVRVYGRLFLRQPVYPGISGRKHVSYAAVVRGCNLCRRFGNRGGAPGP